MGGGGRGSRLAAAWPRASPLLTCTPEGGHGLHDRGPQAEGARLRPVPQHGELSRDVVHGQRVRGVLQAKAGVSGASSVRPRDWSSSAVQCPLLPTGFGKVP